MLTAGHDISIRTTTSTQTSSQGSRTNIDRVAGVYVTNPGGTLIASAAHDVNLVGAILSNTGENSRTQVHADNDIHLGTVTTSNTQDITWNSKNYRRTAESQEVGSQIVGGSGAGSSVVLDADRDIVARQATVQTGGLLSVHADRDIDIQAGRRTQEVDDAHQVTTRGFLSKKTTTSRTTLEESISQGSSFQGGLTAITAGGNLTGEGVKIRGDDGVLVQAGGVLDLHEARDVRSESNEVSVKKSGFGLGGGSIPMVVPKKSASRDTGTTYSDTAAVTTIESKNGGVLLQGDQRVALQGVQVDAATNGSCQAGALGAAMGELAASLYDPAASNTQADTVQFASMMGGIAVAVAGGDAAEINVASQAAGNAAANNWLAAQQRAQMKKEMDAAKAPTDKLQVFGKWALISGKQDVLTASGVGKGLVEAGISDVQGLAEFLAHPVEGLNGLKQIISSPEARQQLGDSVFAELDAKIARMQTALEVGGDQNAEQLGKDFGNLVWNVGSVLMGAGAAAKGGVALARAGVSIGANTLETAALQFMKLDAGAIKGFKSAEEINALMNAAEGWSPAWKSGTSVAEVTVKPGTTVKMVVNEKSWNAIKQGDFEEAFGGWATFDDVPNAGYAGNQLAMTSALTGKSGSLYVVEVQVARSINAQVGIVGPQGLSTGGGNQLHFFVPRDDRSKFFNYVANSGRAL